MTRALEHLCVLVVDDEPIIRNVFRRWFAQLGARVVEVASVPAACIALSDPTGRFDVVVTDYMMAGLSGQHLIEWVRRNRPELPIVLVTAYADGLDPAPDLMLSKPVTSEMLRDAVVGVVARSRAEQGGKRPASEA